MKKALMLVYVSAAQGMVLEVIVSTDIETPHL